MRGGKREGSGRMQLDNKPRTIRVTDGEYVKVKEFIKHILRGNPYDFSLHGGVKVDVKINSDE